MSGTRDAAQASASAALSGFDAGAVGFVLPALREATGTDAGTASWPVSTYVIGMLAAIPLAGLASPRFGALRLFRFCVALAAAGALLAVATSSLAAVLVARLVQGLGQGPLLPLAATIVVHRWPVWRQGRLVGTLSIAYGAAFLGATVLAPTVLRFGWRATFVLSLGLAAVTWVAALRGERAPGASRDRDQPGGIRTPGASGGLRGRPWAALLSREMRAAGLLSLGTGVGQALFVWFPKLAITRLAVPPAQTALLMLPLVAGGIAATLAITVGSTAWARAGCSPRALPRRWPACCSRWPRRPRAWGSWPVRASSAWVSSACAAARRATPRRVPCRWPRKGQPRAPWRCSRTSGLLGGSLLLGAVAASQPSERVGVETALLVGGALVGTSFVALRSLIWRRTRRRFVRFEPVAPPRAAPPATHETRASWRAKAPGWSDSSNVLHDWRLSSPVDPEPQGRPDGRGRRAQASANRSRPAPRTLTMRPLRRCCHTRNSNGGTASKALLGSETSPGTLPPATAMRSI